MKIAPTKTAPGPLTVVTTVERIGLVEKLRVATKYQPLTVQRAHMNMSLTRSTGEVTRLDFMGFKV